MVTDKREIRAGISEHDKTCNKKFISLFLSLQVKHGFKAHVFVCGIADLQIPADNCPEYLFINSQGFTGIEDLSMLHIKNVPHIIKDHNLVPNKEACLVTIQQIKLKALVWREKDCQSHGLAIIMTSWNTAELTSSTTQINI